MSRPLRPAPKPTDERRGQRLFFWKLLVVGAAANAGASFAVLRSMVRPPRMAGAMVAPQPPDKRPPVEPENARDDQADHDRDDVTDGVAADPRLPL